VGITSPQKERFVSEISGLEESSSIAVFPEGLEGVAVVS
jgi:hypothetical protein